MEDKEPIKAGLERGNESHCRNIIRRREEKKPNRAITLRMPCNQGRQ